MLVLLRSLKKGLDKIANRMKFCSISKIERPDWYNCENQNSCSGGCYAGNFWASGNMFNANKENCKFVESSYKLRQKILS